MATANEIAVVIKARDNASAVLKKINAELGGMGGATKAPTAGFANLFSAVAKGAAVLGGLALVAKAASAVGDAVAGAVGSAMGFEAAMSGIKAVSGATGQQMQQMSKLALDLGRDTAFSANEAAAGITELIKGGVSIADVMGGSATAALNLAAAGGVSVAEAATIAANAMNQFGLRGADMAHVSDLVAGAANASSISVSDFNLSLAAVGAVAKLAGQSFDSTAVAIALLGQQGIRGSDAGTSLKAVLNNLIPTTDVATSKMRELGIITASGSNQFIDAAGKVKDFGAISEILQTQTAGLTESQRLLALELIFGSDGMRAAGVMAKQGGEGFDTLADSMDKVTAATVAAERLNNLTGDIEALKGSVETAGITVASVFLPALRGVAQGATAMVNTFTKEASTLIATAENISREHGIGMIPAALTAVELRIGEVFGPGTQTLFHNTRDAVEDMAKGWNGLAASTDHNSAIIRDAMARLDTSDMAQATERNGVIFRKAWADMAASTTNNSQVIQQWMAETGQPAWASLTESNDRNSALFRTAWDTMAASTTNNSEVIRGAMAGLEPAWSSLVASSDNNAAVFRGAWESMVASSDTNSAAIQGAMANLGPFFDTLGTWAQNAVTAVGEALAGVPGIIASLGPAAASAAGAVGEGIAKGMAAGISGGIAWVTAAATRIATAAKAAAEWVLQERSPSKVFEEIGENVDLGFIEGIDALAPDVVTAISDLMTGAGEAAIQSSEEAFAGLATALGAQFEKTFTIVEAAENAINNARADLDRKYQRDTELEEIKFQRKLQDLREEAGRATLKGRAEVLKKIAQLEEDHGRRVIDLAQSNADRIDEQAFDAADKMAQARERMALEQGKTLRDFQRGTEDVLRETTRKAAEIGKKVGEAVSETMRDAAQSILEVQDRAAEAITALNENQGASRALRTVREAFGATQDDESRAFDVAQAIVEADYQLAKDLANAKIKLGKARGKAETDEERRQADIQYAEETADIRESFQAARVDLAHRQAMDEQARAFRKQQQAALQAFNDALEDKALREQIARIQEEADTRVTEIGRALDEKLTKIRQSEADERAALQVSADEKLNDLRERYYDKIGTLNEEATAQFEAIFATIASGVAAAASAITDLSSAIADVSGVSRSVTTAGGGGGGGATWANQPQAVRDMFTGTHGAGAQAQWEREHAAELASAAAATLPPPTGHDQMSGLPTGPGYYEPVPDTPYWRENRHRFAPLPWGTAYPEAAYGSSDPSSQDVFGGNNSSVYDQYATGGVVPGKTGAARLAVVHGGEGVFTPDQLAALGGRGGGSQTIILEINGQRIASAIVPDMQGQLDRQVRLRLG